MTDGEVQNLLDELVIYTKDDFKLKKAEARLSNSQKGNLYNIVRKCESTKKDMTYHYTDTMLRADIKVVSGILNSPTINYNKGVNTAPNAMRPCDLSNMPFLIKQVLFYICLRAKKTEFSGGNNRTLMHKYTGKNIIDMLRKQGVKLSGNFFTRYDCTVNDYYECDRQEEIGNPLKYYMGQKKEHLSEIIKWLAYQAGKYDYFVDIFGGSGSASAAVYQTRQRTYVYNELNDEVFKYFSVISSDDYRELQKAVKIIQNDLNNIEDWSIDGYYGFDLGTILNQYNGDLKEICELIEIYNKNSATISFNNQKTVMAQIKGLGYYFYFKENKNLSDVQRAVGTIFSQYVSTQGKTGTTAITSLSKNVGANNALLNFAENVDCYENLIKNFHNRVKRTEVENLDYKKLISAYMHPKVNPQENEKGKRARKEFESKNIYHTLFYSDSPYVATSGYEKNNVGAFDPDEDMESLISYLYPIDDYAPKFIFSMRACKDGKYVKKANRYIYKFVYQRFAERYKKIGGDLNVLVVLKKNKTIPGKYISGDSVRGGKREAVITDTLELALKYNQVIEIFICNFPIVAIELNHHIRDGELNNKSAQNSIWRYHVKDEGIVDKKSYRENYDFYYRKYGEYFRTEVYSFEEFMHIIDTNMNK